MNTSPKTRTNDTNDITPRTWWNILSRNIGSAWKGCNSQWLKQNAVHCPSFNSKIYLFMMLNYVVNRPPICIKIEKLHVIEIYIWTNNSLEGTWMTSSWQQASVLPRYPERWTSGPQNKSLILFIVWTMSKVNF
jgi:hypothetical protein